MADSPKGILKWAAEFQLLPRTIQALAVVVSGSESALFLASGPDNLVAQCVMGGLGVVLELVKLWAWHAAASSKRLGPILLAVVISCFSLLGSLSFASLNLAHGADRGNQLAQAGSNAQKLIESIREQKAGLEENLRILAPDWVSQRLRIQERLDRLNAQELALASQIGAPHPESSLVLVDLNSVVLGIKMRDVMTIGILLIGLLVEIVISVVTFELNRPETDSVGVVALVEATVLILPCIESTGRIRARNDVPKDTITERDWRRAVSVFQAHGLIQRRLHDRSYELAPSIWARLRSSEKKD